MSVNTYSARPDSLTCPEQMNDQPDLSAGGATQQCASCNIHKNTADFAKAGRTLKSCNKCRLKARQSREQRGIQPVKSSTPGISDKHSEPNHDVQQKWQGKATANDRLLQPKAAADPENVLDLGLKPASARSVASARREERRRRRGKNDVTKT